jgi:hypothetical protein
MFRASSCPSSGVTTTAVSASGLPRSVVIAVLLVVVRPVGPTTNNSTAITKLRVKPEADTAVVVTPDDGHEDARNMLSCI